MIDIKLEIQPFIGFMIMITLSFFRCWDSRTNEEFKIYIYYMIGLLVLMIMRILTRKLMKKIAELRKEIAELRKIKKLPMGQKTEEDRSK